MHKTLAVAFCLFMFVTTTSTVSAKPAPLEAPDPGRGIIGVRVKVAPPARIGASYADTVYFVRVVEDADRFGAKDLIHSNYTDGRDVFLLNAEPGRYVAVGCKLAPKSGPMGPGTPVAPGLQVGLSFSPGAATVMFAKADIMQTEVEVRAKAVVFMGQIEASSSTKMDESDEAQAHYLQVIAPTAAHQGSVARVFSGHVVYTAAFKSIERGPAAEKEYWDEAIEKHFTNELAWASRIAHRGSATDAGAAGANATAATGATLSDDAFLSAVCVGVNTVKARANGQPKEAAEIARLVCQTVMTDWDAQGCREHPDQPPCKKRLASFDGSLKASDSSMLFAAARAGQTSICSVMLAMGSDPNAVTSTGWTPLMIAAAENRAEIVQLMLEKGANVEAKNADSKTAAMIAAERGHTGIVEILKKAPAAGPPSEPSDQDTDAVKELQGEIEAGLVKLSELHRDLAKLEKPGSVSDEQLAQLDRETRATVLAGEKPGETQEQKIERLTLSRDLLLDLINDNASSGAEKNHQPPPPEVTVDTLREATNKQAAPP